VVSTPFGIDLTYLNGLLAKGLLDPQIGWRGPWVRVADAHNGRKPGARWPPPGRHAI
jgi:hypothetical protein